MITLGTHTLRESGRKVEVLDIDNYRHLVTVQLKGQKAETFRIEDFEGLIDTLPDNEGQEAMEL